VVVANPPSEDRGVPKWVIIPVAVVGGLILLVLFIMFSRESDSDNTNLRVNVNSRRTATDNVVARSETDIGAATGDGTISVPTDVNGQSLNVPGSQAGVTAPAKATVVINAKIATRTGDPQAVRNERFYLLDKDLESILTEANIEPIEGQTLLNSFGLSVMFPDRYGEFNRAALRAIKDHIKYTGTTDSAGRAQLGGIEPDSYYLFGVTKAPTGFAVWSSPVSVIPGENMLNLTPQRLTEVDLSAGD
jgi:hypothetical protein